METNKTSMITVTDETIVAYYKENPHLDFVIMNHIFISILKNLSSNLTDTINTTINSKILSIVSNIENKVDTFKTSFNEKLHETKREYMDDVKIILTNNILTNNEKINAIIEKNTDNILTKTTMIINDIIPKNQDKNYALIESCIKASCVLIEQDTKKLLESRDKNENQTKDIITNIESIFSKMISTIQQPIFTFIQSSEERTSTSLQQMKDGVLMQNHFQDKLTNELNDFLNKYKNNSSTKGNVSETELYHMLQFIMPHDEVLNVSSDTASCDFRVNRKNKENPTILFENKDYIRNVTTDEVKKFERDLQLQKTHGIFISQKTPITFKENFQIDIIDGLIHLYIPNANYDVDKLKTAIEIIDNLSSKLQLIQHNKDDGFSIDQIDVDELADEYRTFGMQKTAMQETIKNMNKQLLEKLEEMQLPKIKKLLMKLGNIENDNDFKCMFCNIWSGKNKASLAAHTRNCKCNNQKNKHASVEIDNVVNANKCNENEGPDGFIENIVINEAPIISSIQTQKKKTKSTKA
jgi:hypothetical protein